MKKYYHLWVGLLNGEHFWQEYEDKAEAEIMIDYYTQRNDVSRVDFAEEEGEGALQWETVYETNV